MAKLPQGSFGAGSAPLGSGAEINEADIAKIYAEQFGRYQALLDEVAFILNTRLSESTIKLHDIEHRVKQLDSLIGKCKRHNCATPF